MKTEKKLSEKENNEDTTESKQHIRTMEGKPPKYVDAIRQCCIQILSHNVGINHVSPVIRIVLATLTSMTIDRLPSPAKMSTFLAESRQLVMTQIGEQLLSEENLTLHRDGTTKQGQKYYGAQIASESQVLNIGLTAMKSGSAQHSMDVLLTIFQDIEKACHTAGATNPVCNTLISKIKNTMTDRSIVEKNVNDLLKQFRSEVIPSVVTDWENLPEDVKTEATKMNNFFCGLHHVVGLADQAQQCLAAWEKMHLPSTEGSESGIVRLIRTACKALEAHCSEQSGNHTQFRAFVASRGVSALPLARFVGNRFNILFYNASGLYYLRQEMLDFYDNAFGTPNRLRVSVRNDLGQAVYLAGCRALGIIDKLVTGPLWRQLTTTSISDMSNVYSQLCESFDTWKADATSLLDGSACAFTGASIMVDEVHNELLVPSSHDQHTLVILQLLSAAFSTFSKRLLTDHLPGGEFHSMPASVQSQTKSVSTTNVASERLFAQLDRMKREKPNSTLVALEGMILFSSNKTGNWLAQQSPQRRHELFASVIKGAQEHRELYQERCAAIEAHHRHTIQEKQRQREEKEKRDLETKLQLTNEISEVGLWTTTHDVSARLAAIPLASRKIAAIKSQIRFRKIVLQQTHQGKTFFQWSAGGKVFTWQELAQNLLKLISAATSTTGALLET